MHIAPSEFLLRLLIAVMILLATVLLGIGDGDITLSVISLVAILISAYLTDTKRMFELSQGLANGVALATVGVSAANAYYLDRHGLMVAVAELQSYLQFVLLFQPKTPRVYWQLALLSLGQMAIASTLVPGPTFGVFLLAYLLIGVMAFALLLAVSEQARVESRAAGALAALDAAPVLGAVGGSILLCPAASPRRPMRALRIIPLAVLVTAVTVLSTASIFFLVPRWTVRNRETVSTEPLTTVSFSKQVTLGELGDVVNNPDLVMRISFYRSRGTIPFKLAHDPLLRGTVVTRYSGGQWSQSLPASPVPLPVPLDPPMPYVRQRIKAEPMDVNELFCVFPVFALQPEPQLRLDLNFDQLVRHEDARNSRLDFELATTGIVGDRQRQFLPCDEFEYTRPERIGLLQLPGPSGSAADSLPSLSETAASVLRENGISPANHAAAATALSDYFHLSQRFVYSLERVQRNPELDPLEDFISEHPVGHCEYFAGALVLMLRSQGIPARMAIGFKGGEWNTLGGYYQVQQLHAHTWVEVCLVGDQIPADAFEPDERPRSAWMMLDPTEGTQETSLAAANRGLAARLRQAMDYANVLWINYVAGLNSKRQQQGIYEPLAQGVSAGVENLVSPVVWQARLRAVAASPVGTFWQWYRRHWFDWRGGLVAGVFSLGLAGLYLADRWLRGLWRSRGLGRLPADVPRVLEIYRRLEAALASHGFARRPAQTAREFAVAVGGELAESIDHRRAAHLPRRIVDVFYRVRFGGRTLDDREVVAVEHALVELELALAQPH